MKTFIRAAVAALAIAAVSAPLAIARPIDPYMPETQEPAPANPAPTRPLDRYTPKAQDAVPRARAPIYWAYDYEAGVPQDRPADTSDDTPWAIVGLAITGACLIVGGAALASRSRVRRRARVAA